MSSEFIGELKKWANDAAHQTDEDGVDLSRAVDLIGKTFAVQTHEVAILALTPDALFLKFLAPESLRMVGQIPLSSTNSVASRTFRERRPETINHFSVVPHSSVFEAVPIAESQRAHAIQKIMSAPIMQAGKAIGVVQISRKGKTIADAGPDFTPSQMRELKTICDVLATCLTACAKEKV